MNGSVIGISKVNVTDRGYGYNEKIEIKGRVIDFIKCSRKIQAGSRQSELEREQKNPADIFPEILRIVTRVYPHKPAVVKEKTPEELAEASARSEKESARRRRKKIADIINLNFAESSVFLTLTFAGNSTLEAAEASCQRFCHVLNKEFPEVAYIRVLELQKSGKPHFHFLLKGCPSEWLERKYYVFRSFPGSGILPLKTDGNFTTGFRDIYYFPSKNNAVSFAKRNGAKYAYTSPIASIWGMGFCEIHEILSKNGKPISDIGAYMLKYIAKETELPKGITRYSFSRTKLRKTGIIIKGRAAWLWMKTLWEEWKDCISHYKKYKGENEFLGRWTKVYVTLKRELTLIELEAQIEYLYTLHEQDSEEPYFCLPSKGSGIRQLLGATAASLL